APSRRPHRPVYSRVPTFAFLRKPFAPGNAGDRGGSWKIGEIAARRYSGGGGWCSATRVGSPPEVGDSPGGGHAEEVSALPKHLAGIGFAAFVRCGSAHRGGRSKERAGRPP